MWVVFYFSQHFDIKCWFVGILYKKKYQIFNNFLKKWSKVVGSGQKLLYNKVKNERKLSFGQTAKRR